MPLLSGKKNIGNNIRTELKSGKKKSQAIAIALSVARRMAKADGGGVDDLPDVGSPLVPSGPIWGGTAVGNKAADIGSKLASQMATGLATLPRRAIENSQYSLDTGNYDPSVPMEAATTLMGGSGAVPASANELRMGIKAYHGSPHDFDRFSLDKIGTGEGAQAYGHGLYFAGNENVAKSYRDTLAGEQLHVNGKPIDPADDLTRRAAMHMDQMGWTPEQAATEARSRLEHLESTANGPMGAHQQGALEYQRKFVPAAESLVGKTVEWKPAGKMYEVDINADPEHFLDWDKPLSEQHPQTQDAVKQAMGIDYYGKPDPAKAESMWKQFGNAQAGTAVRQGFIASDDKLVADRLRNAGVPGIKYLDQGSRSAGNGSSNYVVFDDNLVNILRKYGLAGLPAAGMAASSIQGKDDHMAKGGAINRALSVARRAHKADGGGVFSGYIPGTTGGRTDNKDISVESGSYVVPADILSGLGDGNSHAGAAALHKMLGMDIAKANGGSVGEAVPIVAASGEMVLPRDAVSKVGGGDLDKGHAVLDAMVKHVRAKTIKHLKRLPSPKRN